MRDLEILFVGTEHGDEINGIAKVTVGRVQYVTGITTDRAAR